MDKKAPVQSENPRRKIGYARVSTSDQNPDMQIAALKAYGVPEDLIFVDKASGGTMNRPQFLNAIKYAQMPSTELVVWKLDRLGRTVGGIIETLKKLDEREVALVSLTEKIDTGTAVGKAFFLMIAVIAELERNLIAERTKAGIDRARARGEQGGRPIAMTPERVEEASKWLARGERGNAVWEHVKTLPGPNVSRAAYYAWQKEWDENRDRMEGNAPEPGASE